MKRDALERFPLRVSSRHSTAEVLDLKTIQWQSRREKTKPYSQNLNILKNYTYDVSTVNN